jgi:hypothetical protein
MADLIRYDLLAQDALRGIVRKVLIDVARAGLPGEHHFFIEIDSQAPGVKMSDALRAQHPEKLIIVLQHQFWDLSVGESGFEVGLSFKGTPERVIVPFAAVTGFHDPSVQFGLKFVNDTPEAVQAATEEEKPARAAPRGAASEPEERPARKSASRKKTPALAAVTPEVKPEGAQILSIEKFRKK